jgi:RimJ/RimL family protein N-acetyltransferase
MTTYEITVQGHLDDHWAAWLDGIVITRTADATTSITLAAADQAQLYGLLAGLRDIGAAITELRTTGAQLATRSPGLAQVLQTERLTLRPAAPDDADATWAYRRLDAVNAWLSGPAPDLHRYRALFAEHDRLADTVIVVLGPDAGAPIIGDFMLRREDAWAQPEVADQARGSQAELGWVLDPGHTGHGYATEAVGELLRHCFEDLRVRRVTANAFLDNDSSVRLMERVGMRRELHAVGDSLHRSGRWLDSVGYAILDSEWRELRGRVGA